MGRTPKFRGRGRSAALGAPRAGTRRGPPIVPDGRGMRARGTRTTPHAATLSLAAGLSGSSNFRINPGAFHSAKDALSSQ